MRFRPEFEYEEVADSSEDEYEFTTHDNAQASGSQASGSRLMVVVVLDM